LKKLKRGGDLAPLAGRDGRQSGSDRLPPGVRPGSWRRIRAGAATCARGRPRRATGRPGKVAVPQARGRPAAAAAFPARVPRNAAMSDGSQGAGLPARRPRRAARPAVRQAVRGAAGRLGAPRRADFSGCRCPPARAAGGAQGRRDLVRAAESGGRARLGGHRRVARRRSRGGAGLARHRRRVPARPSRRSSSSSPPRWERRLCWASTSRARCSLATKVTASLRARR